MRGGQPEDDCDAETKAELVRCVSESKDERMDGRRGIAREIEFERGLHPDMMRRSTTMSTHRRRAQSLIELQPTSHVATPRHSPLMTFVDGSREERRFGLVHDPTPPSPDRPDG
jgi:hypothetical protein